MFSVIVLVASVALQCGSVLLAIRLMFITGRRPGWVFISLALGLMVVRRLLAMGTVLHGHVDSLDLEQELTALAVSLFMFLGIAFIREHFESIRDAELTARKSEERYRAVADYTYDWEYWVGPDETILYMSPSCQRHTLYSREAFVENPELMSDIVHPDDCEAWRGHRHDSTHGGEGNPLDFRIVRPDGEVRWMAHVCRPVYGDQGQFLGWRASNRDITERKRATDQLQETVAELQETLSRVKTLHGLLPICASCHKVRDDKGYWEQVENYVQHHSEVKFSHGLCPTCALRLYPEIFGVESGPENSR